MLGSMNNVQNFNNRRDVQNMQGSDRMMQLLEFEMSAAAVMRAADGVDLVKLARGSDDLSSAVNIMIGVQNSAKIKGHFDVTSFASRRLKFDEHSVLDVLSRHSVKGVIGDADSGGLELVQGKFAATIPRVAIAPGYRAMAADGALLCTRRAGNRKVLPVLRDAAAITVASSGGSASDVLGDIGAAVKGLSITPESKLILIVDSTTAASLAFLADESGSLAFPNLSLSGGEVCAAVEALVVDDEDMTTSECVERIALVVDARGLTIAPGQFGLLQKGEAKAAPGTEEADPGRSNRLLLSALRSFGLKAYRPAVAVIEGVQW